MVPRDRYGENLGVKTVFWGFAVCDEPRPWSRQWESCGRRGPVSPGFVFESTSTHKHAIVATPEGLRELARRRRASEGSQAGPMTERCSDACVALAMQNGLAGLAFSSFA